MYLFKKYWNYIFLLILFFVFLIGLYLRVKFYLYNRPLWHDEASLAINILYKNYMEYFGVLLHNQSAPPLFMIFTKFISSTLGIKESVLRFIPIYSSILSIPIFFIFSKKILKHKVSLLFAIFLFCINYYLIYYSQEFKQYSSDILFFLSTFLIISNIKLKHLSIKKTIIISFILSFFVLLSLPTLFIIFAFLFIELYENKNKIYKIIIFFSPIFSTFTILYHTTLLPSRTPFLVSYWNNGFFSFNFLQNIDLIKTNITYYFYPNQLVVLIFILLCLGIYLILRNLKERDNLLLTITGLLILIAFIGHQYPIMQRVSLYITPFLIILVSKPIDLIYLDSKVIHISILLLYVLSFNSYNFLYFKEITKSMDWDYDARSSMKYLKENYKNEDLIVVNIASDSEFLYYSAYYNLNTPNYIFVQTPNRAKNLYFDILDVIPKNKNVWFFYPYDYSHSPVIPYLKEWSLNKNIFKKNQDKNSLVLYLKT